MKRCCKKVAQGFRNGLVAQALVHQTETAAISEELAVTREGLKTALEMIGAARSAMWTPADDQRLVELRKLAEITDSSAQPKKSGRVKI
jgi:hypothetical protein